LIPAQFWLQSQSASAGKPKEKMTSEVAYPGGVNFVKSVHTIPIAEF